MSSWPLTYWPTKLQRLAPDFRGRVQILGEILGFSINFFKIDSRTVFAWLRKRITPGFQDSFRLCCRGTV